MSEFNKALVHLVVEEIQNKKNLAAFDEYFAPDWINHDVMPGFSGSLEGAKEFHRMLFKAFPDFRVVIKDVAAEGDKVWMRKAVSATHKGEFMGIKATGKRVSWQIIDIMSVKNGKCTEHWFAADVMTLMQELQSDT